jgi:hypothetical protein
MTYQMTYNDKLEVYIKLHSNDIPMTYLMTYPMTYSMTYEYIQ